MNIHDLYRPILRHFRTGRMQRFARRFKVTDQTTILDIGGGAFNWILLPVRPRLTILNIHPHEDRTEWATYIMGDGCNTGLPSAGFDIVFSNSVIEHVGGIEKQRQFAEECRRCGRAYFVQTPNKWFPVDTHTLMPFGHWLPRRIFNKLIPMAPRFILSRPDPGDIEDFRNMRLLSKRDLQELFPEAEIVRERFMGITKSLIAVSPKCP